MLRAYAAGQGKVRKQYSWIAFAVLHHPSVLEIYGYHFIEVFGMTCDWTVTRD